MVGGRGGHTLDRSGSGQRQVADSFECGNEPSRGIPWLAKELLAYQVGLCSTEYLFRYLLFIDVIVYTVYYLFVI
jgi:hypothetical protein